MCDNGKQNNNNNKPSTIEAEHQLIKDFLIKTYSSSSLVHYKKSYSIDELKFLKSNEEKMKFANGVISSFMQAMTAEVILFFLKNTKLEISFNGNTPDQFDIITEFGIIKEYTAKMNGLQLQLDSLRGKQKEIEIRLGAQRVYPASKHVEKDILLSLETFINKNIQDLTKSNKSKDVKNGDNSANNTSI